MQLVLLQPFKAALAATTASRKSFLELRHTLAKFFSMQHLLEYNNDRIPFGEIVRRYKSYKSLTLPTRFEDVFFFSFPFSLMIEDFLIFL